MITPEFKGFLHSIVETLDQLGADVIIYKLKYYLLGRIPKHLRDIGAILAVQGDTLDYSYIASWAARIGAGEVWDALVAAYRSSQP